MFSKNKNKSSVSVESLGEINIHTMKDDMDKMPDIANQENKDFIKQSETIKMDSPLLGSNEESVGSREADNEEQVEIAEIPQIPQRRESEFVPTQERNAGIDSIMEEKSGVPEVTFDTENKKSGIILYIIVSILVISLGAGGYYYWLTISDKTENTEGNQITNEVTPGNNATTEENLIEEDDLENIDDGMNGESSEFSEKANFLAVSQENFNKVGLTALFNETFTRMDDYQGDMLEFLLVDSNNAPISFKDFSDKFGIILPDVVKAGLSESFSIFLYNKDGVKRMSLVVSITQGDMVFINMKNNESSLVKSLDSLFLGATTSSNSTAVFKDSSYNDVNVRYLNLNPDFSIDYAVTGNYLIFATHKDGGRLIIDKLAGEKDVENDVFNENEEE